MPVQTNDKLSDIDLRELSAVEVSALIKSKQITATQLVKAVVKNAKRDNHLQENMTVCVEAYIGEEGGREGVKLEEQVLITSTGFERISSYPYKYV